MQLSHPAQKQKYGTKTTFFLRKTIKQLYRAQNATVLISMKILHYEAHHQWRTRRFYRHRYLPASSSSIRMSVTSNRTCALRARISWRNWAVGRSLLHTGAARKHYAQSWLHQSGRGCSSLFFLQVNLGVSITFTSNSNKHLFKRPASSFSLVVQQPPPEHPQI